MARLGFRIDEIEGGALSVTPMIDGVCLDERVEAFELTHGYTDPAGGYGGLVPAHYAFGDLSRYFLGQDGRGETWVLGCACGEVGCWPLECRIVAGSETVTWDRFRQPHRSARSYAELGPFVFERADYELAVAKVAERVAADC